MNSKLFVIYSASIIASLFVAPFDAFADTLDGYHTISYGQARDAISLYDHFRNDHFRMASATITYVFEDIDSGNDFNEKTFTGYVNSNEEFAADTSYFVKNSGQFLIRTEYEINGQHVDSKIKKFVIVDDLSGTIMNDCTQDRKLIVKPDYSKVVCVYEKTFDRLSQRGWVGHNQDSIMEEQEQEPLLVEVTNIRLDNQYSLGDQINISGYVWGINGYDISNEDTTIVIQIISPNGDLVDVAQIKVPYEKQYHHKVNLEGPKWQQNGLYEVKIFYNDDIIEDANFAFSTNADQFSLQEISDYGAHTYEELCGFPVTNEMRMKAIYDNSYNITLLGMSYFDLHPATFSHVDLAPHYASNDPHLNYVFYLDDEPKEVAFRIGACDVDGSNIGGYEKIITSKPNP